MYLLKDLTPIGCRDHLTELFARQSLAYHIHSVRSDEGLMNEPLRRKLQKQLESTLPQN